MFRGLDWKPPHISVLKDDIILVDRMLTICALALVLWGILCVYSAGAGSAGRGEGLALRQSLWLAMSCCAVLAVLVIGHYRLLDIAYSIYGVMLVILLFVPILAPRVKGAQSWLSISGFTIQPSEFGKIALILMMSKFLSRHPPLNFKTFVTGAATMIPSVILVILQPDFGSALVYIAIAGGMLIAAGTPAFYLGVMATAGGLMAPVLWFFLKDYQKMRLLVFLDPMRDPLGAGYNAIQSRIAVGSGGFFGKGFMMGMQSKLRFLPEPHTDFIFSVSSEEFGFVSNIILLVLFAILFWRIINTGFKSRDRRCKLLVSGVAIWIWVQMFESIGMSIGLMPITGLPLPFLSYGGSSLLSLFIALGLVASISVENAIAARNHVF